MSIFSPIGRFFGSDARNTSYIPPIQIEEIDEEGNAVHRNTSNGEKVTSLMSPEELRARRTNMIENSKFGRPAEERFMLVLLKLWLFIGPIAFVALTTSEVAYILTSLVQKGDHMAMYVVSGGALFIDLAMMFVTFGVAIKRRDLAEKRESGGVPTPLEVRDVQMGTLMWLVFAVINVISQTAFLMHVVGTNTTLYIFVASRVIGFILADASTAFFLAKVDSGRLRQIAKSEREKGGIYAEIAKAEGERKVIEAKTDAEIELLEIRVRAEREDAQFLAELKRQAFKEILERRGKSNDGEGPARSRVRRLDD